MCWWQFSLGGSLGTPGAITGATTICSGTSNTYSITAVAGATSYSWTLPGGWSGTSTTNSIVTTAGATSGNITVTASNACGISAASLLTITVNANPTTSATNGGAYCVGATIQLNSVGGSATDDWVGPNSYVQNNVQNPSIASATLVMAGDYTVTVTNGAGCTSTSTTTVVVNSCVGIDGHEDYEIMNVYPNPFYGNTTIAYSIMSDAYIKLDVYNIVGVKVQSLINMQQESGEYQFNFNTQNVDMKSGLYFISLSVNGKTSIKRIVVMGSN